MERSPTLERGPVSQRSRFHQVRDPRDDSVGRGDPAIDDARRCFDIGAVASLDSTFAGQRTMPRLGDGTDSIDSTSPTSMPAKGKSRGFHRRSRHVSTSHLRP